MNTFRNFCEICFALIFAKFKCLSKQFILTESPDHVFEMIYNMFIIFLHIHSGAFAESFHEN